jgi:transposase
MAEADSRFLARNLSPSFTSLVIRSDEPGHPRHANHLRRDLRAARTTPVIPSTRSRKRPIPHDARRYRERWRIEAAFCRLKDFRRVASRYDKLAVNFASAVALAAVIAFWC